MISEIIAYRSYGRSLRLVSDCSCLWQDLGLSYYHQMACAKDDIHKQELAQKAIKAVKRAVRICPSYPAHWSVLGVIAASKGTEYSKKCFINGKSELNCNVVSYLNVCKIIVLF